MRRITVTKGIGKGQTELSAFDAALQDAGIANYNLIHLSSIIPAGSEITLGRPLAQKSEFGNKLYVVIAEMRQSKEEKRACAGLGWVTATDGSGRGLFVEHIGESESEVQQRIEQSLTDMTKNRTDTYGAITSEVASIACGGASVCALVAAVYKSENW